MAERQEGEGIVGRRELTPEQEKALAAEAEARRGDADEWDFARPAKIDRGGSASAVLSVRVPLSQMKELRRLAGQQRLSLSRLLQDAVECYMARPRAIQLRFAEVQRFLAFNVEPELTDTDVRTPSSPFSGGPPATLTSAQWRQLRAAS
jgi:hypothetical protein